MAIKNLNSLHYSSNLKAILSLIITPLIEV